MHVTQNLYYSVHFDGPIALRFSCADGDLTPAGQRFGAQEDGGRPRSFVCVVNPLPVCGRGSNGHARFFQSLHRLFVHAEDRHVQ